MVFNMPRPPESWILAPDSFASVLAQSLHPFAIIRGRAGDHPYRFFLPLILIYENLFRIWNRWLSIILIPIRA